MSVARVPRLSIRGIRQHEETHRPTSQINVGEVERWASAIAGTLLVTHGLRRGTFRGLVLGLIGGGLVYRGMTGHSPTYAALKIDTSDKHQADPASRIHQGMLLTHAATVNRSAEDLYECWRDVENAPGFMDQIVSVERIDETKSRWTSTGPLGKTFSWDSEIINDQPGRLIAWKSLPGGDVNLAGTVRFEPASGGRGTVVTLQLNYEPPAGIVGLTIAKILGQDPDVTARENLRHFKQLMETGEIPTTQGQTSGRSSDQEIATPRTHLER